MNKLINKKSFDFTTNKLNSLSREINKTLKAIYFVSWSINIVKDKIKITLIINFLMLILS